MKLTRIESEVLTAVLSPQGAELHSLKSKNGTEYLWQAGEAWTRRAPILFPIVGKLKDNTFLFKGKKYQMSQHGFARDREFKLVESDASSCAFELKADETSLAIYPFQFRLRIIYSVLNNSLTCRYEVSNEGNEVMFFSVGAHPGFLCPLTGNETFEDYQLTFEKHTLLQTSLKDGLRTNDTKVLPMHGKNVPLSPTLFDNDALVFENGQVEKCSLLSKKTGKGVTMECEGWPYFGVWSKKGNREFVCLEPWYGIADHSESTQNLEEKEGIIQLQPGKTFSCQFNVSIT